MVLPMGRRVAVTEAAAPGGRGILREDMQTSNDATLKGLLAMWAGALAAGAAYGAGSGWILGLLLGPVSAPGRGALFGAVLLAVLGAALGFLQRKLVVAALLSAASGAVGAAAGAAVGAFLHAGGALFGLVVTGAVIVLTLPVFLLAGRRG